MGIGALVIAGTLFVGFGWSSIKMALFASDTELSELTGEHMPEEIKRKIENRL